MESQYKESDKRYLEEKELREESDAKVQALMRRIKELEEIAQRTNNQTITNTSIQMNGNGNGNQPEPISSNERDGRMIMTTTPVLNEIELNGSSYAVAHGTVG